MIQTIYIHIHIHIYIYIWILRKREREGLQATWTSSDESHRLLGLQQAASVQCCSGDILDLVVHVEESLHLLAVSRCNPQDLKPPSATS